MDGRISIVLFSLMFWCIAFPLQAQFDFNFNQQRSSRPQNTSTQYIPPPDSVNVQFMEAGSFDFIRVQPVLVDEFQVYNPAWMQEFDYLYLGNLGAPHKPLIYQPTMRMGFDPGNHQYDLYLYPKSRNRFFNNSNPFTDLYYTAGAQVDALISALFSQNLNKQSNIFFNYRKINHRGAYLNQQVRHTNIELTSWFRSKSDRYIGFLTWNSNVIKNQNNGGIEADSLLDLAIYQSARDLVPVNLSTAQTEIDDFEVGYTQQFQFIKGKGKKESQPLVPEDSLLLPSLQDSLMVQPALDSLGNPVQRDSLDGPPATPTFSPPPQNRPPVPGQGRNDDDEEDEANFEPVPFFQKDRNMEPVRISAATLVHSISYQSKRYRFFDDSPESDSSFYGVFQTNLRGIRNFYTVKKLQNTFATRITLGKNGLDGPKTTFLFEPGLTNNLYFINQEPETSTINDLFLTTDLEVKTPNESLDLSFYGHYGISGSVGDLLLQGRIGLDFQKFGRLDGQFLLQRYRPTMIQDRFYVSQELLWDNDFAKTNETNIKAYYSIPTWKLSVGVQFHLIDNLIYFDTNAFPVQAGELVNVAQFILKKDFTFWKFGLNNELVYQQLDDAVLRLPSFWSRHSFYFQTNLFKDVMIGRFGLDIRYNTNYRAESYAIVTGQFHQQNDQTLEFYPRADFFANFRVKTFRASFKIENLSQLILGESYFAAPLYPMRDFMIRFGIAWQFWD